MKIKTEHIEYLRKATNEAKTKIPPLSEYIASGMTAKRWRWDLTYAAN